MKKREQGVLTVEASIVLSLCILFILFLFSFARVYNAQSLVSHAVLQSSDAVALESYLRESTLTGSEADVTELANRFMGTTSISADSYTSLRSADVPKLAKEKFITAIGRNEAEADEKLKKLGVKDGLAGIDFSGSYMDLGNDDVIVYASYTIEMQFGVFGMNDINVTKAAKSKTFGDILFGIETVPENPDKGSASGGGNYKHGTQIQISATPNYGYKFKMWMDGNTDNPRTVTVTGAKTYTAMFEESEFGVNLFMSPEAGGNATGDGIYKYLDSAVITANPYAGYHFKEWSISGSKDDSTKTVGSNPHSLNINQTYNCTAIFEKNSYTVKAEISGTTGANANIVYGGRSSSSMTAPYESVFKLSAPSVSGYKFLGWKEKGAGSYFSISQEVSMTVPARNATYVACYESLARTVKFYDYYGNLFTTRTVNAGQSLGSNMPGRPYCQGYKFNGWKDFNSNTIVYNNMSVYGNWSTCGHHNLGHCGQKHQRTWFNISRDGHIVPGGGHQAYYVSCAYCIDCGIYMYGLCGTCNSWKKWQWYNAHGLAYPQDLSSKYY